MNTQDIKQKLNSKEYSFLRNNEHLGNNIILLTTGGSYAYGTNVESSDLDIRGIATERIEELIGLSSFEQFENKETDTTIYALNKVIKLMLNLHSEIFMNVNLKNYPLRDFKNIYSEMSNIVKDYEKLNHRNRKKMSYI